MIVAERSSFQTSNASSNMDSHDDADVVKAKNYVKDLLKSRIFLGRYQERRLISQRTCYRDVVLLSNAEIELKRDLLDAETKLRRIFSHELWIGITYAEKIGNHTGVCIWTEIDNEPFGAFWFQIKSIKFRENEIMLTLKCIRHIPDGFLELDSYVLDSPNKNIERSEKLLDNSVVSLKESYNDLVYNLRGALSVKNMKEFFTFVFALILAFFTGSTSLVNFLGNFVLGLIREISIFIKNSTPMFLGTLDFFGKIIGGFYILLAMFFKPNNQTRVSRRTLAYNDQPHQCNQYSSKEFD